jgi:hypothetical protein
MGLLIAALFTLILVAVVVIDQSGLSAGEVRAETHKKSIEAARDRWRKSGQTKTIIGIRDAYLSPAEPNGLNVETFDITTYIDRAVLRLENDTGGAVTLTDFGIKGKLIIRIAGTSGLKWEVSDFAKIDDEGEQLFELANNFIIDTTQMESIGDFLQKELRPHDMYTLGIKGTLPYLNVKDLYTLTITHQLPASTSETELIDVDVEIRGIMESRTVGSIGETLLLVRVPSGAWTKTTTTRAKVLATGLPFNSFTRGNIVTVASRDYPGQANYHCDGTDDQVQIQAAVDYVAGRGGGIVELTEGTFNLAESGTTDHCIEILEDNISLCGSGSGSTILAMDTPADDGLYDIFITGAYSSVYDIAITASGSYTNKARGIYTEGAVNLTLSRLSIAGGRIGIYCASTSSGIISECIISIPSTGTTEGRGIDCDGSFTIINNKISFLSQDASAVSCSGIKISTATGGQIVNNNIYFVGHANAVAYVYGIYLGSDVTNYIVGTNYIEYTGSYSVDSIALYIYGNDNAISSNRVVGDDFNNASISAGLYCRGDRNVLNGNNIQYVTNSGAGTGYGIYLVSTADRTTLSGNLSLNNDTNYDPTTSTNTGDTTSNIFA